AGCDTCPALGWVPRAPWEVVLPWTRWGAAQVAVARPGRSGPDLELIGPSPATGIVRLRVSVTPMPRAISIYDVCGRLWARVPVNGEGVAVWDGKNEAGRVAPAGLYFARLPGSFDGATLRFVRLR